MHVNIKNDFWSKIASVYAFKIEIKYKNEVYSLNKLIANGWILEIENQKGFKGLKGLIENKKINTNITQNFVFDYSHYLKKPFYKQKNKIKKALATQIGVFDNCLPYFNLLLKGAFLEILNKNNQEFTDQDSQKLLLSNLGNNIISCYINEVNKSPGSI